MLRDAVQGKEQVTPQPKLDALPSAVFASITTASASLSAALSIDDSASAGPSRSAPLDPVQCPLAQDVL